jgi:nitroreductase
MTNVDTPLTNADFSQRSVQATTNDQFRLRWSPRSMTGQALTLAQVQSLCEAGRWAPSCFNSQPWRFIYALPDTPQWQPLLDLLMDVNKLWAAKAGALVALVARTHFEANDAPAATHSFDTGSAWMSMALQAQHMGLTAHAMWGFHHDQAADALKLPEYFSTQALIAFGHPAPAEALPDPLREREVPSPRKALSELMFNGAMG